MERKATYRLSGLTIGAVAAGALALCGLLVAPPSAPAAVLIPSVVMTRPLDGNSVSTGAGLAVRGPLVKDVVDVEIGGSYRQQSADAGALMVHDWPLTGSLWVMPLRHLYAGGGVGMDNTTLHYPGGAYPDETHASVSAHLGGGLKIPLGSSVGLDAQGRYNFASAQQDKLTAQDLKPETWSTRLGLAMKFQAPSPNSGPRRPACTRGAWADSP